MSALDMLMHKITMHTTKIMNTCRVRSAIRMEGHPHPPGKDRAGRLSFVNFGSALISISTPHNLAIAIAAKGGALSKYESTGLSAAPMAYLLKVPQQSRLYDCDKGKSLEGMDLQSALVDFAGLKAGLKAVLLGGDGPQVVGKDSVMVTD